MILLISFLKHIFDDWLENNESTDTTTKSHLPPMPVLEEAEEVKEGKGLKILTPNKLFTRPSILLAQIKPGNSLYKLKNET